uniref:Uncharacterized protein n=1 Tax=Ditylenchus dipsaci TaxID=166011 RepID=A0A915E273_9BILA
MRAVGVPARSKKLARAIRKITEWLSNVEGQINQLPYTVSSSNSDHIRQNYPIGRHQEGGGCKCSTSVNNLTNWLLTCSSCVFIVFCFNALQSKPMPPELQQRVNQRWNHLVLKQ